MGNSTSSNVHMRSNLPPPEVDLKPDEWKAKLEPHAYHVLREAGTERAFTGKLVREKRDGTYVCGGCGNELFDSGTKFESGTGWPSFYRALGKEKILEVVDYSFGRRVEVLCARCHGHLGHVFPDGPAPTHQRYCMNSVSLDFKPAKEDGKQ